MTRSLTLGLVAVLALTAHAAIWSVGPGGVASGGGATTDFGSGSAGNGSSVKPGDGIKPGIDLPHLCRPPAAEAGFARPWEGSIPVSTYSTVNTRHGNLLTVIPVIGWNGVGPDVGFALYHNSAAVEEASLTETSLGFDVGPGWSTSYSAHLIFSPDAVDPVAITVVADDGTRDVYTLGSGGWLAPAGVYDRLTAEAGDVWRLTFKDQSYQQFDASGALTSIVDAVGNALTVEKGENGVETLITDAACRKLYLYKALVGGRWVLDEVFDPVEPGEGEPTDPIQERSWLLHYFGPGGFQTLVDPVGAVVTVGYDGQDHILSMMDRRLPGEEAHSYQFTYTLTGHRVVGVTDPEGEGGAAGLVQSFARECLAGPRITRTTYTGRRGANWTYEFDLDRGTLQSFTDPLGHEYIYDFASNRNLTTYRDPLGNEWTFTYDGRGNPLTATDPLGHASSSTYDALNNLTSSTDALGNTVYFLYELGSPYESLPTQIQEPDEQGDPTIITRLEYYDSSELFADGLLKSVRDPNGVLALFEYDRFGQLYEYGEGEPLEERGRIETILGPYRYYKDSGSRTHGTSGPGGSGGSMLYNSVNQALSSSCPIYIIGGASPRLPAGFPELPSDGADLPVHLGEMTQIVYDGLGATKQLDFALILKEGDTELERSQRTHFDSYNELGLATGSSITSEEWDVPTPNRAFTYTHDLANGTFTRVGPDGVETFVQTDLAGRVQYFRRGPVDGAGPVMSTSYTYYADGRVHTVTNGNGTTITYLYDNARRLTRIAHENDPLTLLRLDYTYTARDEIETITEFVGGDPAETHLTTFTHDKRGRLTHECRTIEPSGPAVYDLTYAYDAGGNRLTKTDSVNARRVDYHYDLYDQDDPEPHVYDSDNNRLMYYETFDTTGGPGADVLLSTTWYYYSESGNLTRIVTAEPDSPDHYEATRFGYAQNGQAVTYILGEAWDWDGDPEHDPTNYDVTYAREFRYDGARQRYLNRELDPVAVMTGDFTAPPLSDTWSDYDGNDIYGDFTITGGRSDFANARSFQPGLATVDPWSASGSTNTDYFHTNHLGTTRSMSDDGGVPNNRVIYTAFGERISGDADRYGYAGAYGYQSHDFPADGDGPLSFLHVGHRYYDPSTGRFLQRDPIGIMGGSNVYQYASARPLSYVDADGLMNCPGGPYELNPWWPKPSRISPKETAKGIAIGGAVGACVSLAALAVLYAPELALVIWDILRRVPRQYPVRPQEPDPPRPDFDDMYPGHRPPLRPSIPDDLPPGPLPPMNPDDYPDFYP